MEGITTVPSSLSPKEAMDRLEAAVRSRHLMVFARVDHAKGASLAGVTLRPSEALIFGHPRVGTPLMQANPLIGIDLPLRALVWQDEAGKTWISCVDPAWLAQRYGITGVDRIVQTMTEALAAVANAATS
jgi:uncharacterized protein (DUF302 family)